MKKPLNVENSSCYECGQESRRVAVYVDGFNLYYGLKSQGWKRYYWLNIWLLAENLLRNCQLCSVKYFTAHVKGNPQKTQRQQTYLSALRNHCPRLEIFTGRYLFKERQCRECGNVWRIPEEKQTDVNIATEMLADAFQDRFDTALVISGDSDLVPPIDKIHKELPDKKVLVAFPPRRSSNDLAKTCTSFFINQKTIRVSLLPNPVRKPDGTELRKPSDWR